MANETIVGVMIKVNIVSISSSKKNKTLLIQTIWNIVNLNWRLNVR